MLVQRLLSVWIHACLRLCLADSSCFPNLGWNELKDSSLLWISAHRGSSARMNSCSSRFRCLCGFMLAQVGGHPNSVRPDSELVWILLNSTYLSMWICACLTWGRKNNIYSSKIQLPAWISARPDLTIVWVYAHLVWTYLQIPLKIPCSRKFRPSRSICSWASMHAQVASVGCTFEWTAYTELPGGNLCGAVKKETQVGFLHLCLLLYALCLC